MRLEKWKVNKKELIESSEIWPEKAKWINNKLITLETSLKLREDKQAPIKMEWVEK